MKITAVFPRDKLIKVSIYRSSGQTSGAGGAPTELTPVVNTGVDAQIDKLSGGQARRIFGITSSSKWILKVGSAEDIAAHDLVLITSGPYVDQLIEAENVRKTDVLKVVASQDTDRVVKES